MTELTTVLGMKLTGGVHNTLGRLVEGGLLERVGRRYAPTEAFLAVPLVGPASAGLPCIFRPRTSSGSPGSHWATC